MNALWIQGGVLYWHGGWAGILFLMNNDIRWLNQWMKNDKSFPLYTHIEFELINTDCHDRYSFPRWRKYWDVVTYSIILFSFIGFSKRRRHPLLGTRPWNRGPKRYTRCIGRSWKMWTWRHPCEPADWDPEINRRHRLGGGQWCGTAWAWWRWIGWFNALNLAINIICRNSTKMILFCSIPFFSSF